MDISLETKNLLNTLLSPLKEVEEELRQKRNEWRQKKRQLKEKIGNIKAALPDMNDIKLLEFLSSHTSNELVLLPISFQEEHEVCDVLDFDLFESYRYLLEETSNEIEKEVIRQILKHETFFESGAKQVTLKVRGRIEGYKGDETEFTELEYTDLDEPVTYAISNESLEFFCGTDSLVPGDVDEVDYGDWDDTYAEAKCIADVIWLRKR